jgi:hypothetical protein
MGEQVQLQGFQMGQEGLDWGMAGVMEKWLEGGGGKGEAGRGG